MTNEKFDKSKLVRALQREHMGKHSGNPEGIIDIINEVIRSEEACGNMKEMEEAGFSTEHIFKGINHIVKEFADIHKYSKGIKGKNILEIGCGAGADVSMRSFGGDGISPGHAITLSHLGGNVVGLDLQDSCNEHYKHIQVDLTKTPIKNVLPLDFTPDIVIARSFFDSPTLIRMLNMNDYIQVSEDICSQVHELLPDKGIFFTRQGDIIHTRCKEEKLLENLGFKHVGDVAEFILEAYKKEKIK